MADDTQVAPGDGTGTGADAGQDTSAATDTGTQTDQTQQATQDTTDQQQAPPPPPPPPPLTPDEIIQRAEERAFQRMASWQGRRDKDLFDSLGNLIDSRLRTQQPPPPPPASDPATILENPDAWAEGKLREALPRILDQEVQRRTEQEQRHAGEVIRHAGAMMDGDPLFQGAEGQKLGNEVIGEMQKNFGSVRGLNPQVAAQLLVSNAVASIVRKKAGLQTNPLAGNKPTTGPIGTVKPPPAPAVKPKPVKLSSEAAALAKRWNYNEEDIARVFGEDK